MSLVTRLRVVSSFEDPRFRRGLYGLHLIVRHNRHVQDMRSFRVVDIALLLFLPVGTASAESSSPLSFDVRKGGTRNYSLDWGLQLAEAVPVKTAVSLGIVAGDGGRIEAVPLGVTARLGALAAPGEAATLRHALELNVASAGETQVTARAVRPFLLAPNLDAELRGAIATGLKAEAGAVEATFEADQQMWISGLVPRMTVIATTSVATGQKGVAAALRIERRLARGIRVSAEIAGGAMTNSAGVSARYNWNW